MSALQVPFAVGALALFFFVPGYLLVKALWPEKRWRGPDRVTTALEMVTGGFLASLGLFLLVGFALGNVGDFQAGISDPVLEGILGAFALLFLLVGWWLGAYRAEPPAPPAFARPAGPGETDLTPTLRQFHLWAEEERRLRRDLHQLRRSGGEPAEVQRLEQELKDLRDTRRRAERDRDALLNDEG